MKKGKWQELNPWYWINWDHVERLICVMKGSSKSYMVSAQMGSGDTVDISSEPTLKDAEALIKELMRRYGD